MALPQTNLVTYPDLSKLKQRTVDFQKTVRRSIIPGAFDNNDDPDNDQIPITENLNDPE